MTVSEELEKLAKLHESGELTSEQYEEAKQRVLTTPPPIDQDAHRPYEQPAYRNSTTKGEDFWRQQAGGFLGMSQKSEETLDRAANTYITLKVVGAIVGFIVFVVVVVVIIMGIHHASQNPFGSTGGATTCTENGKPVNCATVFTGNP